MTTRGKSFGRLNVRLLGAALVPAGLFVASVFAQPDPGSGFDCVIQPDETECRACSGCTYVDGHMVCGNIEKAAKCLGGLHAKCNVTNDGNGNPIYTAECVVPE